MSHVAVLGAGLGGTIMAYELRDALGPEHKVSVVNKGSRYSFVPSNPWVAVGWRDREAVEIDLGPVFARRRIDLYPQGAKRLHPDQKRIELTDGSDVVYDYVVIATGPELAFDEIEGFGPAKETQSICFIDHALDCVAIPPVGKTPVPVGVPKSGFMIESMVTATAQNIASLVAGREPTAVPTWNAVCLADFGDGGVAFVAQPQIPPRNVNWSSSGAWVHAAEVGFEKYFLHKMRSGQSEPFYERIALQMLGIEKLKTVEHQH